MTQHDICAKFWAILGDFGRFWAILGDFGRFWAILGDFGRFWAIYSLLTVLKSKQY
jgi:hypothetical protein